jgi:PGF-CTERM protein
MKGITARIAGVLLCLAVATSLVAAPAAAQTEGERFLVELDAAGDADVSVTFTYDLDSEDERAAFEELQGNETARKALAERFGNRMAAVAEDTSAATDREMSVGDPTAQLRRDGDVGTVELSVAWSNLAAVDGDRLTVTEPFASGFEPDRAFAVVPPEGYGVSSAEPTPSGSDETTATWDAGTSLEGFEAVVEPTDGDEATGGADDGTPDGDATEDSPGFGVAVALVALSVATIVARRGR